MIDINDSLFSDSDLDLSHRIIKFIRLRDINQFENLLNNRFKTNLKLVKQNLNNKMDLSDEEMEKEQEEEDEEDEFDEMEDINNNNNNNNKKISCQWLSEWNKIVSELNELKQESIEEYLENYTNILQMHLKHKINLDLKCFNVLINCIKPELVDLLFNNCLISSKDYLHLSCIYERQTLFNSLQPGFYTNASIEPCLLLMSISILFYKSKCFDHRLKIIDLMNRKLSVFINRKHYNEKFRTVAIKHFIKSAYLNGILTGPTLNSFLSNKETTTSANQMENDEDGDNTDSDTWPEDDEENADMDEGEIDTGSENDSDHERARIRRDFGRRALIRNQLQPQVGKTVGDLINLNPEELKIYFPLSLKNLSRIKIKNLMSDFTPRSVNKLNILPNVLKDFLLFKDEIDCIVKCSKDFTNKQDFSSNESNQSNLQEFQRQPLNDIRIVV